MEKFFKISARGSTVKTELLAGVTTFMAMAYILMVNAGMFAELGEVSYGAIYIATAISAVVGTVLIGLLSNLPLAQASGMGLNAFFVYTVCLGLGLSYANALVLVLIDGIVFILLTVSGLRKKIFDAIPKAVRVAIPAGIGLFIAFVGLQNAGLIVPSSSTGVTLASFNLFNGTATWGTVMPLLVTLLGVIVIAALSKLNVKGAVLYGMLGGTALYYLLGLTVEGFYDPASTSYFLGGTLSEAGEWTANTLSINPFDAFRDFGTQAFGKVFTEGFDFSAFLQGHSVASLVMVIITTSLAFCLVDMFDTLGTLYGACARGKLLTPSGEVPNMERAMLADAIATTTGAVCGTSTVTTFVESSAGIAAGAKTGLASIFTSLCFIVAMFLSPIAQLIPSFATAAALIYVGVLMMNCVRDIDWTNITDAVPAFLTVAIMPFSYNISYGIAFGIISYLLISAFTGKIRKTRLATWFIALLFGIMLFMSH